MCGERVNTKGYFQTVFPIEIPYSINAIDHCCENCTDIFARRIKYLNQFTTDSIEHISLSLSIHSLSDKWIVQKPISVSQQIL